MILTKVRPAQNRFNRPAVNTIETDNAYTIAIALPGWDKKDVSLEVDGDLLLVKGEMETEQQNYRRREFGLSAFEKSFHLPETIDLDKIGASLEQGILNITLPKVPEAQPIKKAIAVS